MKRFEFSEGTSNKFWEAETKGKELRIRFGKIGSNGQLKLKVLASPAAAEAEMAKVIAEKTKKGYQAVGGKVENKAAALVASTPKSGIKAAQLKVTQISSSKVHRIALFDDDLGHVALGTGNACFASSDGKKFHRRPNTPGVSYGLFVFDGIAYSMGGPFAFSSDAGATWRTPKQPYEDYMFAMLRDSAGTYWLGCADGVVMTSDRPDKGWKKAKFKAPGKVMAFAEIDGQLFVVGAGCGVWNGKKFTALKGTKKSEVVTRITQGPDGGIVLVGDGGIAYRSKDRGKSFTKSKTGVDCDLEDCAWVAGSLFAVGGGWSDVALLRSDDEGKSWKQIKLKADNKLWGITSWGDGAFLSGDAGVFTLTSPKDTYWRGTKDRFAPEPPKVDSQFTPLAARSEQDREAKFDKLFAAAIADHTRISAKQRSTRTTDENAKLATAVDEGAEGAEAIYADWLQDSGDPRGELAQIQLRLAKDPKNKELKKAEKALLKQHAEVWLGKLVDVADMIKLEWNAGFIAKARLASSYARDEEFGDQSDDDEDGEKKPKPAVKLDQVLAWLLASPSARFLRDLTVGIVQFDGNNYTSIIKELGKHYMPALRSLFLGDFEMEETELNWSNIGNLEPAYAAMPNLEKLKLRSGDMKLGTIVLPHLKQFEVITGGMDAKSARSIATAVWPSLEKMSVQIGPESEGTDVKVKDLQPILDGDNLPHLSHLGVTNFNLTGQLVEPLATSKILPQLAELDLSMGTLGDEHVTKIFAMQKAFAHLAKLDVNDNYLTNEGRSLLKQAKLAFNFGEQREDEGDPSDRYASAYE
jgi:predicted DNA-binding WGR domain protein